MRPLEVELIFSGAVITSITVDLCCVVTTFFSYVRVSNVLSQNRAILLQDVHYLGVYVNISSTSTNTTSEIDLQRHHFDGEHTRGFAHA